MTYVFLRRLLAVASMLLTLTLASCSPAEQKDAEPDGAAGSAGQASPEPAAPQPDAGELAAGGADGAPQNGDDKAATAQREMSQHGGHDAHHGGLVLMDRDLHFEVVARSAGTYRIYFTDEVRRDLPASTVSNAVINILRPKQDPEAIDLEVDDSDKTWLGKGRPVTDGETIVRVTYSYKGQPYSIDIPFWTLDGKLTHRHPVLDP